MLENSKLSSRFKKADKKEVKLPYKFSFVRKNVSDEKAEEIVEPQKQEIENAIENEVAPQNLDISVVENDLKKDLIEKINSIPVWSEYSQEKQKELIKSFVDNKFSVEKYSFSDDDKQKLIEKLSSAVIGFGPLEYLISQENVSAIFVNGTNSVHIEIGGRILNTEMMLSNQQLEFLINSISGMVCTKIDLSKNVWNVKYNNLLISVITANISNSGTNIIIRKTVEFNIESILDNAFVSREVLDFIINAISEKKNIIFSGDINSGKTTFLDVLINTSILNKRAVLLEKSSQINSKSNYLMKFSIDTKSTDFDEIVENIMKIEPEYIISDLNTSIIEFSERKGCISTLCASSVEAAISKLVNNVVVNENLSEKLAKNKVLTNYDYLVQINKLDNGKRCVTSIVELSPARTAALSVKLVSKLENGQYINDFPQPLTSFRVETLISQSGSMSSRFYH